MARAKSPTIQNYNKIIPSSRCVAGTLTINPVTLAKEYQKIMQTEGLTQSQLAVKLGISRVRVNQYLALLKLPKERQTEILKYGKEQMITERKLRKNITN